MYLPKHFEQHDPEALAGLMATHPLATLVSVDDDGPTADHIPLEFIAADGPHGSQPGSSGLQGVLRGHVARANPIWQRAANTAVLAIFSGPQAYITPSWYPSKAATHKVVPTWNYAVVHAHGVLRVVDDAPWLRALVGGLTDHHESRRSAPWSVSDAPDDYVQQMLRAIVGIEIPVPRLIGKWKISQNRSEPDRLGVADGLGSAPMAALVRGG
jgi:transcriptional regulator